MEKMIAKIGDVVNCMGLSVTIAHIFYQEFDEHWDIEFLDTNGCYRHWKQLWDGGELISKED